MDPPGDPWFTFDGFSIVPVGDWADLISEGGLGQAQEPALFFEHLPTELLSNLTNLRGSVRVPELPMCI